MTDLRPPDIVVVVLDTVRRSEAPGGDDAVPGLPFLERMQRESVSFSAAFAPAPWTVPSHASLLTGLSPWQHGVHARGRPMLPPEVPTIPSELRSLGYRSVSLSSNPYLGNAHGLTEGFDEAYWGGWHEPFLRGLPVRPHARGDAARRGSTAGLSVRQLTDSLATAVQRHPGAWRTILRARRGLSDGEVPEGAVSAWIEPTLDAFLARQSADRPLFALVNLMDAHEPYIGVPGGGGGLRSPRQDRASWVRGRWDPTERELGALRNAYRRTYHLLDERLTRLEAVFRAHRRWDDAVVVVTSDHGQAFGEHGILYHGLRPDETLLHVPLMVRWPEGADAGRSRAGRISLGAVHDLALAAARGESPPWERDAGRVPAPIPTAIADGLLTAPGPSIPEARRQALDRTFVAAYHGPLKVTLDVGRGEWTEFDLDEDPLELSPKAASAEGLDLRPHLTTVAREAFGAPRPDVAERLASWGYV